MVLSDGDIQKALESKKIIITPNPDLSVQLGSCSIDLRLGDTFRIFEHGKYPYIDPSKKDYSNEITKIVKLKNGEKFIIQPGEFVLGVTMEKIKIADDLVARVEGRSSLGRLGIIVHSTAGFIDAGFEGTITLEITNINRMPVALYPGMRVCQLAFEMMSSKADVPYSKKKTSKYQGQAMPQESKIANDPEFIDIADQREHRKLVNNEKNQKKTLTP